MASRCNKAVLIIPEEFTSFILYLPGPGNSVEDHISEKRAVEEVIKIYNSFNPGVDGMSIRQIYDTLPLLYPLH